MIHATQLYRKFEQLQILKGVDLHVHNGEIVAITGPSGAGKTTLLQILGTLDQPDSGTLTINGVNPFILKENQIAKFRNQHVGFVFQAHMLLPEFTALENVMIPALIAKNSKSIATSKAKELLDMMGLKDRLQHKPNTLSGGEKQRVAVARALVNQPDVVLADEPSGSLDTNNKNELHQLFFDLRNKLGQTFVIVTHDEQLAEKADRIVHIKDGVIVDGNE